MIYRSPYPDVTIPDVSLHECALRHCERLRDRPALIEGPTGRVMTYGQLHDGVERLAASLSRRGFGKGDVLAVYSPNLPEYAIVLYAVSMLGGISTTANPTYTAEELQAQLRDSGARILVTVPALVGRAREAAARCGLREIITIGEAEGAVCLEAILKEEEEGAAPRPQIDPHSDLAVLPYSSGTTGLNKGVMLTHRNLIANIRQMDPFDYLGEGDSVLGLLPFYHIYGMVVVLHGTLDRGGSIVTMPRFDFGQMLDAIERYRIRVAYLVPPIILALAKDPAVDGRDFSSLELVFSGAAPLSGELAAACAARLNCRVEQGYGLTETSPVTHYNFRAAADSLWSIGPPIAGTECMVVSPGTSDPVKTGESGELLVRGPQVMTGYLNAPEATSAALDAEGWLRTGDVACVNDQGLFRIVDRIKELIKYKGLQVAPAELEALLLTHPLVADAAVVRYPDEEAGEVPKAFVVLSQDVPLAEIEDFVARHVAPFKRIRKIERVDAIPKSPSGKILRRVLVERDRA
jgi:acyl-CoA synthetase (AMP-forming)/AMP-acid ligase II